VQLISRRVGRCLERQGLLEQDTESAWLALDPVEDTDAMPQILGSSVSYRIAVGPQQGRKAFMIRTIRPLDRPDPGPERVAKANGFSLHADVSCEGLQRDKRDRPGGVPLCRSIARPPVAVPRLSLRSTGKVVYTRRRVVTDALPRWHHPSCLRSRRPSAVRFHGTVGGSSRAGRVPSPRSSERRRPT
jgi:hypothetical protein